MPVIAGIGAVLALVVGGALIVATTRPNKPTVSADPSADTSAATHAALPATAAQPSAPPPVASPSAAPPACDRRRR